MYKHILNTLAVLGSLAVIGASNAGYDLLDRQKQVLHKRQNAQSVAAILKQPLVSTQTGVAVAPTSPPYQRIVGDVFIYPGDNSVPSKASPALIQLAFINTVAGQRYRYVTYEKLLPDLTKCQGYGNPFNPPNVPKTTTDACITNYKSGCPVSYTTGLTGYFTPSSTLFGSLEILNGFASYKDFTNIADKTFIVYDSANRIVYCAGLIIV
ncbi:hypothetical protein AX774_g3662 [Zancudomyces culisetae]|uniref:Uncharacterized protein n=1 Tax=Zancudomyces culisetae TaxID=1213189 RepID=A0A1R1PPE5_ZANCU|nr:hypothetical protein AX774_g3662 [Zancudomyces culisetae]|eukprot:OMH82837.1 hypothetical protein AX774_g3662 [Zancudomyces culisetae]